MKLTEASMETLSKKRQEWERNLKPLFVFYDAISTFVVLEEIKEEPAWFHLHRYVCIGGNWDISVDARTPHYADAFKWLQSKLETIPFE